MIRPLHQWHARFQPSDGFTLIELLLYVSIVGGLLLAVSLFFTLAADARVKHQTISEVDQQGTAALSYLTQTVRNATAISAPAAGGSAAALTLTVPTAALSPTVFDLSGTTLQVKEGTGAAVALTNSRVQISGLTFRNLSRAGTAGIIQASFTLSRVNTIGRNEYNYQKTFTSSAEVGW